MDRQEQTEPPEPWAAARAVGDPLRHWIVKRLEGSELAVSELAEELGLEIPHVAYHVRVLRKAGLIRLLSETPVRGAVEHVYRAMWAVTVDVGTPKSGASGSYEDRFRAVFGDGRGPLDPDKLGRLRGWLSDAAEQTPTDHAGYKHEVRTLRELAKEVDAALADSSGTAAGHIAAPTPTLFGCRWAERLDGAYRRVSVQKNPKTEGEHAALSRAVSALHSGAYLR